MGVQMQKSKIELRGLEKVALEAAVDKVRQARRAVTEAEAQATSAVKMLAEARKFEVPADGNFGWVAVPNADKSGLEAIEYHIPEAKPAPVAAEEKKVLPGPGANEKKKGK